MMLFHQVEVNSGREFGRKGGSVRDAHKKGREAEKGKKINYTTLGGEWVTNHWARQI